MRAISFLLSMFLLRLQFLSAAHEELIEKAKAIVLEDERVTEKFGNSGISFMPPHHQSQSSSSVDGLAVTMVNTLFRFVSETGEEGVVKLLASGSNYNGNGGDLESQINHLSIKVGGEIIDILDHKSNTKVQPEF